MRAFVYQPQVHTSHQENACRYGALASGRVDGGINTYAYVGNKPLSFVDPEGLNAGAATAGSFAGPAASGGGLLGALAGPVSGASLGAIGGTAAVGGAIGYGTGTIINNSLNRILEHYIGTSLGGLIYEACNEVRR